VVRFDKKKICEVLKRKYNFIPSQTRIKNELERSTLSSNWRTRLSHQISNLRNYDLVKNEILDDIVNCALLPSGK